MQTQNTTQLANTQDKKLATKPQDIRNWLGSDYMKQQIAAALPKHCTAERFMRVALTALMRTPKLFDCTQESLLKCMLDLSAMGLEPDGRRAHLIPYGNQCTLILDYKGILELVRRSGEVSYIHLDAVYENDTFEVQNGSQAKLTHIPSYGDPGKIRCFYSFVKLRDGSEDWDVMTLSEVEAIRKRSKAALSGPWVTDFAEMGKKTVFRRHSKKLPLSPELHEKIERDDEQFEERNVAQKPIFPGQKSNPFELSVPEDQAEPTEPTKPSEEKGTDPRISLMQLIGDSSQDELRVENFLRSKGIMPQSMGLATISDAKVKQIINNWPELLREMNGMGGQV